MKLKSFPMPLILFLIFLSAFTAYGAVDVWRSNQEIKLPEQFLGYWKPYGRGAGNVGLEFKADGTFKYIGDITGDITDVGQYKVINIDKNGRVNLIVHKIPNPLIWKGMVEHYKYYNLAIEDEYSFDLLSVSFPSLLTVTEDDWNKSRSHNKKRIKEYLKMKNIERFSSGLTFSR